MVNDTRSSRKNKDDENNHLKGRQSMGRGSATSGSDAFGLRRSARETSSKKSKSPSPSNNRKSEQLEKLTLTPPVQRKYDRAEKVMLQSPLRRSERGKNPLSSSSSGSKKSEKNMGSSFKKQKMEKKKKGVKQLTMETREIRNIEEQDVEPVQMKKRRLHARAYRALFKQQPRKNEASGHNKEMDRSDSLSQENSNKCSGGVSKQVDGDNECSEGKEEELREEYERRACERAVEGLNYSLNKFEKKQLENHGLVLSHSSPKHSCAEECQGSEDGSRMQVSKIGDIPHMPGMDKEMSNDAEGAQVSCCAVEELQTPHLIGSLSSGSTLHGDVGLDRGHQVASKSKSNAADVDFDSAAIVASKAITNSICLSPAGCEKNNFVETCCTSLKRKRVDHDSTKQDLCSHNTKSIQGLCDTSITKDRGLEPDVATGCGEKCNNCMQLNESHVDIQTDGQENTCLICKLGGKLLCCDGLGCRQSYHLSCLEPPLEDVPLGVWHCVGCIQKKIESGVYSVTKGIESIWDAREVKLSDVNGSQRQKQFFVKYRGLAHVHNRWVPENQLLREAPLLVANFNQENQVTRWKTEWTVPQRLLQKRLLMSDNQRVDFCKGSTGNILHCHYEWFVKWHGLDYEHASWELENASFLNSPEARSLIAEYKIRHKRAKKSLFSRADKISKRSKCARSLIAEYKIRHKKAKKSLFSGADKISKRRKGLLRKLSRLPAGGPFADHDNYLNFVNKLREWQWHKGQNAVVIDDLERITKVILFVLSMQFVACRPFLIISDSAALRSWEDEFSKLAPSINVVVYNGNKDMRKNIRTLEFYEQGGCIMFQVLISPLEFIVEDLQVIECVGWETVIVDECQSSTISTHFEQIKVLTTDMRLLLVSGQLKESEYLNLLSLLDSHGGVNNGDDLKTSSIDNIGKLKERLSRHIAFDCRSSFSRFVEYWVPVQISNVQLEQYCATLLSNFLSLRSSSKNDRVGVGALSDILISTRKCCDHPYVVDPLLQTWLTKNVNVVEYLDVGIKASAKLHLLDTMLLEIKNHGLRVLILFQSIGGSGKDSISIGDILDDFLLQRFGSDSYERVEWGLVPSKQQSALNKFNNKECGRFVFLLETRACRPSVKLSSVDTVIIFDSDWNPVNDLRALQKITFDPEFENRKIFRIYSSCTVEEKVLILAKKGMIQDGKLLNISRTTSQMLLMWGASYLFNKLDELHSGKMPNFSASTMPQHLFLKNVMQEFLAILHQSGKYNDVSDSIILKVQQSGATYSTNSSLLGEKEIQLSDEEPPHIFWTKLLEGKRPRWIYSSGSSQRNRKRVNNSPKIPEIEKDEVPKKCKKVVNNNSVDPSSPKSGRQENIVSGSKEGASETPRHTLCQSLPRSTACMSDTILANQDPSSAVLVPNITVNPEVNAAESAEGRKSRDAQRGLHLLLKPEISKLCETLRLSEDVKSMVEQFLEYILNNHHISREPVTILQAFQISLCWIAASLLKHKIDHRESLALAKQHLNFSCHEEEVDHVFSKLACLKSIFLYRTGNLTVADSPNASTLLPKDNSHARVSLPTMSYLQEVNLEVEDWLSCQECSDKQVSSEEGWALVNKLVQKDISGSIKKIQKKCHKRMAKLIRKQQEEIKELNRISENEKEELERAYIVESLVIHSLLGNNSPRSADRLKIFDSKYTKRFEEHRQQMDLRLKDLEEMHLAAKRKEQQWKDQWVEKVKSWAQVELLEKLPSNEPGHGLKYLQTSEQTGTHTFDDDVALVSGCLSEGNSFDKILQRMPVDGLGPPEIPQTVEAVTLLDRPDGENDQLDILALAGTSVNVFQEQNRVSSSGVIPEQVDTVNPCSEERGPDAASISMPDGDVPLEAPGVLSSHNCVENVTAMNLHLSEEGGATLSMPDEQVQVEVPKTSSSSDIPKNVASINLCSSEGWASDAATLSVRDTQFLLGVPEIVSSSIGPENAVSINSSSSVEHIPDGATSSIRDEEVAGVLEDGNVSGDGSEVSAKGKSINQQDEAGQNINQNPHFQDQSLGSESPFGGPKAASFSDCSKNAVSANPPSSEVQIPDGTTSSVPGGEVPSGMPDPAAAGVLEVGNINVENVEVYALTLDKLNAVEVNQRVEAGSINNQYSSFQDPSLGHAPSAPPVTTPAQGGPLPSNQAPEDECSLPSTSIQSRLVDAVPANRSHHEAPVQDTIGQLQVSPSLTDSPSSGQNLPSNCGTQHHPSSEGHASFQIARGPMQLVENSQRHPIQTAPPVASRTSLHLYPNPLQHELERLKKETDQTIKIHEDAKLQVKSDCEKEIEEVVAQIRSKYDRKLQEMEAEFTRKKKDLDANHDLVLMNKILAEAFRSKCIDGRSGGAPGMQQDSSSSFRQQPVQMQTAQCPSFIAGPSLAPGLQSTTPPAQVAQRPALITSPALAPGLQSTTPPVQVVQHSALFSAPPASPPHIHSISPPTGNLVQVCSEIRAPAPHLQLSRPSHGMPSGPSATSPSLLQRPPGIPPMAYQCSPYTRAHQGEPVGVLSALSNSSLSALDLLMDGDNRAGANSQFSLPRIRELRSVSDTLNVSEFCTRTTEQVTPTNIGGVNPIVCLSDDDG